MNEEVLQLALRWVHVVTAVLWVGLTYALAWVLPRGAEAGPDARAAAWLRYAALAAWSSGASLLLLLYGSGSYPYLLDGGRTPVAADWLPAFLGLGAGFLAYEPAVAAGLPRGSTALAESGPCLLLVATLGYAALLERAGLSRRALYVHAGAFLATAMLANVWLRTGPTLLRGEGHALLRLRHNARLSIPLLLLMVAVDQPGLTGHDPWQASLGGVLVLGYGLGWWLERALPPR